MVPKGWEVKTLEQAKITVTDGDRGKEYPKSSEFFDSGYCLFLSAKNVTKKGFSFLDTQFISEEKHKKLRKGVVKKGDIVLTTRGSVGQFAYYDHTVNFKNIRINSGMVTLGCSKSELESDFFYALSKSPLISRQIDSAAFGSAQPQLTVKIIKSLKLPVPPFKEQQKIAKILSTWDKAISTTERLIDNSIQQKKALMQQLLTGKKRLVDDKGKRFAGEWEEKAIKSLGKIYSGGTPSTSNIEYWDGNIDWVTPTDITKQNNRYIKSSLRKITVAGLENSSAKLMPKNSLLICTRATIGAMAITANEMCTNQGFKNIVPNIKNNIEFIYYLLTYYKQRMISKASGSTFLELSKTSFENMIFKMPSIKEQQKIAAVLSNADKEIELLKQQLADLQQEKKALMQQLLTGKKRVVVDG